MVHSEMIDGAYSRLKNQWKWKNSREIFVIFTVHLEMSDGAHQRLKINEKG